MYRWYCLLMNVVFVAATFSAEPTRTNHFDSSSSKTRYLYGSTHPTVSQSSIGGRLMQEDDLFIGEGYSGNGDATRIIKTPTQPFRINGLHYYWDPFFVPSECKSPSEKSDSSWLSNDIRPTSEPTVTVAPSTTTKPSSKFPQRIVPVELLGPIAEEPIVFIASRATSTTTNSTISPKPTSTSSSSTTSKRTTPQSTSSSSSTKATTTSSQESTSDIDDIVLFLQSLRGSNYDNSTIGEEVQVSRARRQAVGTVSRNTTTTTTSKTTTAPPTPIRPVVNITEVDPCFNANEGSPKMCTRLLDRWDSRDPFMHITFPNGTKVQELAWRCPVDLFCCEWECCEMKPPKKQRTSVMPFIVTAAFMILAVILCIFCASYCKESEQRRRVVEHMGPNDFQMTVTNPPQAVESEDFDEGPQEPPPVPRMHFHHHEEPPRPSFVPPPIPPADRVNGTYR